MQDYSNTKDIHAPFLFETLFLFPKSLRFRICIEQPCSMYHGYLGDFKEDNEKTQDTVVLHNRHLKNKQTNKQTDKLNVRACV